MPQLRLSLLAQRPNWASVRPVQSACTIHQSLSRTHTTCLCSARIDTLTLLVLAGSDCKAEYVPCLAHRGFTWGRAVLSNSLSTAVRSFVIIYGVRCGVCAHTPSHVECTHLLLEAYNEPPPPRKTQVPSQAANLSGWRVTGAPSLSLAMRRQLSLHSRKSHAAQRALCKGKAMTVVFAHACADRQIHPVCCVRFTLALQV